MSRRTKIEYSFDYLANSCKKYGTYDDSVVPYHSGFYRSRVYYDEVNNTLYTDQGSVLSSNGFMNINLVNFLDLSYCSTIVDGLGLMVRKIEEDKSHYAPFRFYYHTVRDIYNLYTDKLFQGYIGKPSSFYNHILVGEKDLILRYYDGHAIYLEQPYFTVDKEYMSKDTPAFRSEYFYSNQYNRYELDFEWRNVWKHVPLWEKTPAPYLRLALRILAKHISSLRLEYKRDLFIGICHKSKLSKGRVLLFSYLGRKLSKLNVPSEITRLAKNILNEFGGYTSNAYFSWYYLPILEPIEYPKFFNKAISEFNSLPASILCLL